MIELLACPRDRTRLHEHGDAIVCEQGHEYPYVDGIPVLVVDDELEPTQPGYWATREQIDEVRSAEPPAVEGEQVDPYVADLIIGTHGNLYRELASGMPRYPIPDFPPGPGKGLLLDIGCNWGRWTLSAARAGYDAIGIDPSFEAIVAARRIARQLGVEARYVVADGRRLPFVDETFDVVFSYGVLQHFSKPDVAESVGEIKRVVKRGAWTWVQMPNSHGALNVLRLAQRRFSEGEHFDVRYWSPGELKRVFGAIGPTKLSIDGFLTLNPQASDLDLLPRRFRAVVRTSEALKQARFLMPVADSVNVQSVRT